MIVKLWKYARRVLHLLPLLILMPVVLIISMVGYDATEELVLLLLASFVPIFILLHSGIRVITGGRLGVTDDHIVLGTRDQLRRRVQPGQLVYGTRFISSGDVTVYTRTGKGPIYRDADMRRYVLPRLHAARSLNAFAGYFYLLREGERLTVVSTVTIAWLAGLVFYMENYLK